MQTDQLIAMLICVTAVASYINYRYIKLPKTIGLTLLSLGLSIVIMMLLSLGQYWAFPLKSFLSGIDFSQAFLQGMLSYLLFAGALHINVVELSKYKHNVALLATASVVITCVLIGLVLWYICQWLHVDISLWYCLLFGALIAPTDPISVIGVMKQTNTPNAIRLQITGESLFNDAVGIFLFVMIYETITGSTLKLDLFTTLSMLAQVGLGGILYGYVLGHFVSFFLRKSNHEETAILLERIEKISI